MLVHPFGVSFVKGQYLQSGNKANYAKRDIDKEHRSPVKASNISVDN
jgi:hypothetical protein